MLAVQRRSLWNTGRECSVCKLLTFPSDSGLLSDACLMRLWAELRNEGRLVLCSTPVCETQESEAVTCKKASLRQMLLQSAVSS